MDESTEARWFPEKASFVAYAHLSTELSSDDMQDRQENNEGVTV